MQEQPKVEESTSSKQESSVQSGDETVSQDGNLLEHDRWMLWMKIGVVITLLVSALALALTSFFTAKESEEDQYEIQFARAADEVARLSATRVNTLMDEMRELSTSTTSLLSSQGAAWPQVTVPYFDHLGESFLELTETKVLMFSPVVQDLVEWTLYAQLERNDEFYSLQTAEGQPVDSEGPYAPLWQISPVLDNSHEVMSLDLQTLPSFVNAAQVASESQSTVFSATVSAYDFSGVTETDSVPSCLLIEPVYDSLALDTSKTPVAYFSAVVSWDIVLQGTVHGQGGYMEAVVESSCGSASTYQLHGNGDAMYKGDGDLHDRAFDDMKVSFELANAHVTETSPERVLQQAGLCVYIMHIYPTESFVDGYSTKQPAILAVLSVLIFLFTAAVFLVWDYALRKNNTHLSFRIHQTKHFITGAVPGKMETQRTKEDEMIEEAQRQVREAEKLKETQMDGKALMSSDENVESVIAFQGKPIADLYVATTIMFADISGFTAWSSVREPTQVFQLLESIFFQFDDIARQMGVFKVETVGDCYVAVSGLPEPREDHFVVMAQFAQRCQKKMAEVTESLEIKLGPDTGELALRCGLHSGPVTAGVLRGERSRLQLFGDTMNTASRIETSGKAHLIHVSPETAELIKNDGKGDWLVLREDIVVAKGKGAIQTYWLKIDPKASSAVSVKQSNAVAAIVSRAGGPGKDEVPMTADEKKSQRLIDWNCDILLNLLKKIVQKRSRKNLPVTLQRLMRNRVQQAEKYLGKGGSVIDEIVEIIPMPEADNDNVGEDAKDVELDPKVREELRNLVTILSKMYHDNPFHCFEHASHVTMSVTKLLSRIVKSSESQLQDQTYGITSDPLTQFAVVLAALIHDVDHRGVPNFVLIKQDPALAAAYANKSVAEQNSVDLAWNILMDKEFASLRDCLFSTDDDLRRMRQLIVNSVMATDIFDKDLGLLRKKRWEDAFNNDSDEAALTQVHRKATIVIEHLIQASDVSHTMQHWHVYQKWNERLFEEMYLGYKAGLLENDPSVNWYAGEMGFFDNYVIPLTKKLKECGVFGVSSDEYLNYATNNRAEWEKKGEEIVAKFLKKYS